MRRGGNFFLDGIRKCIGMECNRKHIGELSTDGYGLKLVVTDYNPPPEGFYYYYENPFEDSEIVDNGIYTPPNKGDLNDSAAKRLAFIIAQIKYEDAWRHHWEDLNSELIYTTINRSGFQDIFLDTGLYDNEFPVLSLLATKLLRYFNVEEDVDRARKGKPVGSDNDNIPQNQQLKVVYKRGSTILHTVGEPRLDMKMKSRLEEEDNELFNRGTAHMIAYLIYNYDTYGRNSDVYKFINQIQRST
jgi:hypothetical protein